jgi:hypothetical protein
MAVLRSVFFAALAAFLVFVTMPGLASAQRVRPLRSIDTDSVRIRAEANASMNDVVHLARHLAGNGEIVRDDVVANLRHPRRYACHVRGRLVYFGTDPAYGGRCPEGARRTDGILRGSVYRVPREHGRVLGTPFLEPPSRRDEVSAVRIAELVRRLNDTTAEARRAEALAQEALRDRDRARAALDARPQPPIEVHIDGESEKTTFSSRLHDLPVWVWLIVAAMFATACAFLLFSFLILPLETKPLLLAIKALRESRARTEAARKSERVTNEVIVQALNKDLHERRIRALRLMDFLHRRFRDEAEAKDLDKEKLLGRAKEKLEELFDFQERRRRITDAHGQLMTLRDKEGLYDSLIMQIREAETILDEDDAEIDDARRLDCRLVVEQCLDQIERLPFDPGELKAQIAGRVGSLKRDMELQCGLRYDGRASDEWKAEWEDRLRDEMRKAESAKMTHMALTALVEQQGIEGLAELAAKEGAFLGRAYRASIDRGEPAAELLARDARIHDLEQRLRNAGIDPGTKQAIAKLWPNVSEQPSREDDAEKIAGRVMRPRAQTLSVTASRESQIHAPPSSPMNALSRDVYRFLDTIRSLPKEAWTIDCSDGAARDWAFLLGNCSISAPSIGNLQMRTLLSYVKRRKPEWLSERMRRRTDPPPAPSTA